MDPGAEALILCGTPTPPAGPRPLRAGAVSAMLDGGQLRYLRRGDVEILRAISFVVRDPNWGTDEAAISGLRIDEEAERCRVSYRAVCARADGAAFRYAVTIELDAAGRIAFAAEGVADARFRTNRTGFVVLHPIDGVAGRPVEVLHADGRVEATRFPDLIAPWQPILDIRALTHEAAPGLRVTCRMEGDAFEMEDHRNWGDASFKTYVRPVARGFPYEIAAGEAVRQRVDVAVTASRAPAVARPAGPGPVRVRVGAQAGVMPDIGIALDAADATAAPAVAGAIARAGIGRLAARVDVAAGDLDRLGEVEAFRRAIAAELTLELVLPGRDPARELATAAARAADSGLAVGELVPSPARDLRSRPTGTPAGEAPLDEILAAARAAFPRARIGGGTLAYFPELNRNRPPVALVDFVTHGFAANIHAADEVSMMETLECVPHVARTLRAFSGDRPCRVGFASLGMRVSPYGAAPVPNPHGGRVAAARVDPRQRGLFAASWALAFVARAAGEGYAAVNLAAPLGPFGLFEPGPGFRARPILATVAALAAAAGRPRHDVAISAPTVIQAVAVGRDGRCDLWLVNLGATPVEVVVEGCDAGPVRRLDATSIAAMQDGAEASPFAEDAAAGGRIRLAAFAIARLADAVRT